MNESLYEKHYQVAYRSLKLRCDKNKAIERLMEDGVNKIDASEIIDRIMRENKDHNFGVGLKTLIVGMIILSIVYYLSQNFGRLYYVIMIISVAASAFGLLQVLWPTPYKAIISFDEDDN